MELVWKEISPVRLIGIITDAASVEGLLPPPEGRSVDELLDFGAEAQIEEITPDENSAELSGTITAKLTAIDESGIFAFESSAGFTHKTEVPGLTSGMEINASISVKSVKMDIKDEGVQMSAELEISIMLTDKTPIRVIGGLSGTTDLELKTETLEHTECTKLGCETLRMREELAEAGASRIVSCEGQVCVREASADRDGISVGGVLTVKAVTENGSGGLGAFVRQVPFRERLGIASDLCVTECTAELKKLSIHSLGEEFSLLAMEAEIEFTAYSVEKHALVLPVDAFSPSISFDCLYEEINVINSVGFASQQSQIKEAIELPTWAEDISSPLFTGAHAVVTSTEADKDVITISGLFTTTLVYETSDRSIKAFSDDIPFSVQLPNEYGCTIPAVSCKCCAQTVGSTERAVQLVYSAQFDIKAYSINSSKTVVGLAEKEAGQRTHGLVIGFASSGDTVFDIAKRYSVSCSCVERLNPEIKEPFSEGDRLLLLV